MPKFSIIVPVYNVEREYLEAALNSVLSQTFADWECICVDDGSTNDSGKVLDEFAAKDSRFKVYHRTNQGVSAARNFALEQVIGEWIMFLDGDDLYAPSTLCEVDLLTRQFPACKIVRFWYKYIPENWKGAYSDSSQAVEGVFDFTKCIPASFSALSVWAFAFHNSLVRPCRFRSYIMGEDTIFALECIKNASCYAYTTRKLYGYRQRNTSVCHTMTAKALLDDFKTYVQRLVIFKDDPRTNRLYNSPGIIRYLAHDFVVHTSRIKNHGDRNLLWKEWFKSLDFLASRKEFHEPYHTVFKICNSSHSKILSYLISGIALAIAWRLHLPWAKVLDPQIDDDVPTKFIALDGVSVPGISA